MFCFLVCLAYLCGTYDKHGKCCLFSKVERRKFHFLAENRRTSSRVVSTCGYRRGAVAYFNKSVDRHINLTNRLLRRFFRGLSNDLENVLNSLLCVTISSNNPCQDKHNNKFSNKQATTLVFAGLQHDHPIRALLQSCFISVESEINQNIYQ